MRLLIVEDDPQIAALSKKKLEEAGFAVDWARDGEEGLSLALAEPYDCAVVDVMLPRLDGLSLIREMRKERVNTPVLILSAKRSVEDRVEGLHSGSDDYLTKPFAFSELLARIHALLRRATGAMEPVRLEAGDLSLDLLRHEAFRGGKRINLKPKEFSLLEYLMRSRGRVVSKTMILEHVWDYHFEPQANVVEAAISRLRDKVDRDFEPKMIRTLRGVGYLLEASRDTP
ncbi:MAG: response regulator transcription factor [Acidobacteriota bacterium]